MALLDIVKKQLQTPGSTPAGGTLQGGEQTESVRRILRAKTGKEAAPGTTGPRQSAIQEKIAQRQTDIGLGQLAQKGQIQAAQLEEREADIAQREEQQKESFLNNIQKLRSQYLQETNNLLDNYNRGVKTLDTRKDIKELEQLGFMARMQNDKYIHNLQTEGKRKRLDSGVNFKREMAKSILRNQEQLLSDKLAFERIISADDREFRKELSKINIDYALQIANNAAASQGARQVATGLGGVVTGGIQAYSAFRNNKGDANLTSEDEFNTGIE